MTEAAHCAECGAELGPDTPKGLCARCALRGALALRDNPAAETPGLELPRRFGDYLLLEEIARGGMGVVYRARQVSLDRIVAMKMILAGSFASREFIQRFRAEAQAAASLQHPHIVAIHEVGEYQGQHFFTMDYIEGQSLAERARDRPLPAPDAAQYLKTIAEAVYYAHEHGILHRDLKPSNVLIDAFDQPRITDFGLAKRLDDESDLTMSGKALGSPGYMPPEQALGQRKGIGPHSDVYAMGALLYHLVTGRAPFSAETIEATLMQVVHNEPASPRALNPNVPRDLDTVCLKCLAKEPSRRYATAQELAAELGRILNGEPIQGRPVSAVGRFARWSRRNPVVAGLAALAMMLFVAGLSGVLWQWWRAEQLAGRESTQRQRAEQLASSESTQRERAEDTVTQLELERAEDLLQKDRAADAIAYLTRSLRRNPTNRVAATRLLSVLGERSFALPATPPLSHAGPVTYAEFSPDGQRVITASRDKTAGLWDVLTGEPLLKPFQHDGEVTMARFSPDGLTIATVSKDKMLRLWEAATGNLIFAPLAHGAEISFVEFSPDGRYLLTISGQKFISIWDAHRGEAIGTPLSHGARDTSAHFNLVGDKFLTSTYSGEVRVWDTQTGKGLGAVWRDPDRVQSARFSPDGTRILAACYNGGAKIWDWTAGQQVGKTLNHPEVVTDAAFSPDGVLVVTGCRDGIARLWDSSTGEPWLQAPKQRTWISTAQFSADGLKLLTVAVDNTVGVWDSLTGNGLCEPIQHLEPIVSAQLSPDGRKLVTACQTGRAQLWDIQPGQNHPLVLNGKPAAAMAFSPDGLLLFAGGQDGVGNLWNPRSGQMVGRPLQHQGAIISACFSTDGRKLVTGSEDSTACLWDVPSGTNLLRVRSHQAKVTDVNFNLKGDRFVTGSWDGTARVWDTLTGAPVSPLLKHKQRIWSAKFSPDGMQVVTGGDDPFARLWQVSSGQLLGEFTHESSVPRADFSAEGTRLITASIDGTAIIWDLKTQRRIHALKHSAPIWSVAFSPDSRLAVTASYDNTARLWDVATGKPVGDWIVHQAHIIDAIFCHGGKTLATVSHDLTARLWDVPSGKPITDPLRVETSAGRVALSPDGRWVSARSPATLWEIPQVEGPAPEWLVGLAEAIAGKRLDETGNPQPADRGAVAEFKRELNRWAREDAYGLWVRWFLADRVNRAISPSSLMTTSELLRRRSSQSSIGSLTDVVNFWPSNVAVFIRLARQFVEQDVAQMPTALLNAERCLRLAAKVAPNDPDLWRVRSAHSAKIGNLETAVMEIDRAIELQSESTEFWHYKGGLLEKQNRLEEACQAYARAIAVSTNSSSRIHTNALNRQRDLLVRLNRPADAQAVRLLALEIPPRDPLCSTNSIDLSACYNAGLSQDWYDRPGNARGRNLAQLPSGRQSFDGTEFDVRGVIQLFCKAIERDYPDFPEAVSIAVQRRCRVLHFLHASIWARAVPMGTEIGRYVIHYADGQEEQLPIIHGEDSLEWRIVNDDVDELPHATVVWRGKTPNNLAVRLFMRNWENPRPDVEIVHLSFLAGDTEAAPFLVALTAEP